MTAQMIQSNANMTRALHGTMETQTGPVVMLDTAAGKLGNEIQFGKKTNWRHLPLTNKGAVCMTAAVSAEVVTLKHPAVVMRG